MKGRVRKILTVFAWVLAASGIGYSLLLRHVWQGGAAFSLKSPSLNEKRDIEIFNHRSAHPGAPVIYTLDGEKHGNAVFAAANGMLIAIVFGKPPPLVVAVHSHGRRDIDFRPATVEPAAWRPYISGRAATFDVFLIADLRREIETRFGGGRAAYLFGHSLAGYYALDLPTRTNQHGFAGIYAFSPTFSHDLSLIKRLRRACAVSPYLYATIGLESSRDSAVFDRASKIAQADPACANKIVFVRHPGVIHQFIMLTGQISAYYHIFSQGN